MKSSISGPWMPMNAWCRAGRRAAGWPCVCGKSAAIRAPTVAASARASLSEQSIGQPREDPQLIVADLGRDAQRHPIAMIDGEAEPVRHHADDRVDRVVEPHRALEDPRVAAEAASAIPRSR